MRSRTRRWLSVILATCIGSLALSASAASIDDPSLARGPLDLKRLVATKHDANAPIHLTLVTYGDWVANLLDVSGPNRISFLFNPDRRGRPDFIGEVQFRDGFLWLRITNRAGDLVRQVRAYHPDPNIVTATVPRGLPNPDGNAWLAATERYKTITGPCVEMCSDRIPDHGWLKLTPGQ
jgi:hypothetical protein